MIFLSSDEETRTQIIKRNISGPEPTYVNPIKKRMYTLLLLYNYAWGVPIPMAYRRENKMSRASLSDLRTSRKAKLNPNALLTRA